MFWGIKTTVPFVFYRSRCMKIGNNSSATALLQRAQMKCTVQLHRPIKAGVHMKMSGKSDFLFSLELKSSTIGIHIGKSCFGVFLQFKCELAVYIQEVHEMCLVAMATEVVFLRFFSCLWPCVPPRIFKTSFLKM